MISTHKLDDFRQYLIDQGAKIEEPTNKYETIRFRCARGVGVVYTNKKGQHKVSHTWLWDVYQWFLESKPWSWAKPESKVDQGRNTNFTLFTDASYCAKTKVAGMAYWARDTKHRYEGQMAKENVANSTVGELIAIRWALSMVAQSADLKGRLLVIVVDCLSVIKWIDQKEHKDSQVAHLVKGIRKLQDRHQFDLKLNHVKAHKKVELPRQWVNSQVDRKAKAEMRKLRDEKLQYPKQEGDDLPW